MSLKRFSLDQFKSAPKVVKVLLVQRFFEGFVPITALFIILFDRVGGLSFAQITTLLSVWGIAFLIAELPSSVLADYWSRRNLIIIGGLFRGAGFTLWLIFPSFTGYLLGFILWGITIACGSGADSAFLHNELEVIGKRHTFSKYFGWTNSLYWIGAMLGFICAAIFTLSNANALIIISIISSLIFSIALLFVKEQPYKRQLTYLKTLKAGVKEVKASKKLQFICFTLFSIYMIIGVLEELLPRFYADFGLSDSKVAVFLAVSFGVTALLLSRLEKLVKISISRQILIMATGILLLIAGLYITGLAGSVSILLFSILFTFFRPFFNHHIQQIIDGDQRATINSLPGLVGGLLGSVVYVVMGQVAERSSERFAVTAYGSIWIIVLLCLVLYGRRKNLLADS